MLSQGDDGGFKGPGIFFYTKGMPVMLLDNLLPPFKLVNERIGTAVDVVIDPNSEVLEHNDQYICSCPPACVIVEYSELLVSPFLASPEPTSLFPLCVN
jgi:hypothetical protein